MRSLSLSLFFLCSLIITPLFANDDLYELSFPNVKQQEVSLGQFKDKVLMVNFWATWCPPCVKEMPAMERLQQHFSDQPFEVVAINAGQPQQAIESFLAKMDPPLTFTILMDRQGRSFNEFGIKGLPMSFIFDKEGMIVSTITGEREWDSEENKQWIQSLINE